MKGDGSRRPAAAARARSRAQARSPDDVETAHVCAQYRGYSDGAVLLLVILNDGDHRAREGETGPIQRVHEIDLSVLAPVTDVGAPRLEVVVVRAGGDFE